MCFVLVHVCSTGLYPVRSIVIAALLHILRFGRGWAVVDDAYYSNLHDHSRLGLASKFVEKRSHQTIKYGFGKVRTIGACDGCTSIHAHVDAVLLVGSVKHKKPRLTFQCVLMAALNYVDPCFAP
jgi:hypothetical protein